MSTLSKMVVENGDVALCDYVKAPAHVAVYIGNLLYEHPQITIASTDAITNDFHKLTQILQNIQIVDVVHFLKKVLFA